MRGIIVMVVKNATHTSQSAVNISLFWNNTYQYPSTGVNLSSFVFRFEMLLAALAIVWVKFDLFLLFLVSFVPTWERANNSKAKGTQNQWDKLFISLTNLNPKKSLADFWCFRLAKFNFLIWLALFLQDVLSWVFVN